MTLIIKNGTCITAAETFTADIRVEGGKIALVGQNLDTENAEVVDASGKLVMPGGVDAHTHFDLPMPGTVSSDDHYTGHKAAAFGGTTTVMDFIPQGAGSMKQNVDAWQQKVSAKAAIDYTFHMNVTRFDDQVAADLPGLAADGIRSIKVFMAYNGRLRLSDGDIFQALRIAKKAGILTMLHAENGDVIDLLVAEALAAGNKTPEYHALTRPAWGVVEAVLRGAALSGQADGAPLYVVHMNAAGEVDQLRYAREHGLPVMGETCPQYLFFTIDHLRRPDGAKWVCSPPMRTHEDNQALWRGLTDGTLQVMGTDHCPFFFDGTKPIIYEGKPVAIPGKELGADDFTKIPNGLPGVGDRLPVLWTYGVRAGRLTPNQFVAMNATNPARIFGLYPQKGTLMPGADADLAIWDPEKRLIYGVGVAQHRTDYNLYEDWELVGMPEKVFLRGQLIVDGQRWLGKAGQGQYLARRSAGEVL
ncbi:MAG TPA: dihydropyrimidinase [Anaerolineaceae bacterium]|nr:dihydropyrimidinase [Anaerolineaceae bacterium]HPN52905.1 dihydropyrimidinase [Anaerolineaceae bacterium]